MFYVLSPPCGTSSNMDRLFGVNPINNTEGKYILLDNVSDDDFSGEDDHIHFHRNNGILVSGTRKHTKVHRDVIELDNLNGSLGNNRRDTHLHNAMSTLSLTRKACIVSVFVFVFVLAIAAVIVLPHWRTITEENKQSPNWRIMIENYGTESCIRLIDVDGDGLSDIIFGMATADDLNNVDLLMSADGIKAYCKTKDMNYPCVGVLVALRGYDGKELWKTYTRSAVFELNCKSIDINKDGTNDCIATGRQATIQAIDPKTGKALWYGPENGIMPTWNTYNVITLPDFDDDGVPELLLPHGGDPSMDAAYHVRDASRFILLSGLTGKKMGRFMNMSENMELYMSPSLYEAEDGAQYILYGDGGETVPGHFMIISVADFYRYVMGLMLSDPIPKTIVVGKKMWTDLPRDDKGVITVLSTKKKGVMVPPVIIDMNNDGVKDIVVSAYEGIVLVYDGKTMKEIWRNAHFHGYESYSTPAPGYFDDDEFPDLMIHWCRGAWPDYNSSMTAVLSGKDGKVIWVTSAEKYQMTSDLILKTTSKHRDAFLFRIQGRDGNHIEPSTFQQRRKRHLGKTTNDDNSNEYGDDEQPETSPVTCQSDLHPYTAEILLLDRTMLSAPIRIWEQKATTTYYNLTSADNERLSKSQNQHNDVSKRDAETKNNTVCVVLTVDDRTTGAIGDVDGDGDLDYISISDMQGTIRSDLSYVKVMYNVVVSKTNIQGAIDKMVKVPLKKFTTLKESEEKSIKDLKMVPISKQPWTEYMGQQGNNVYIQP